MLGREIFRLFLPGCRALHFGEGVVGICITGGVQLVSEVSESVRRRTSARDGFLSSTAE